MFTIRTGQAYPVWCVLYKDGQELIQFHHKDLRQLYYAVDVAMRDAKISLGEKYSLEV